MYNNKNIKFLNKDFINITLKTGRYIKKLKKHDGIFKIVILDLKDGPIFIAFSDSSLVINTAKIQLGKIFGLA